MAIQLQEKFTTTYPLRYHNEILRLGRCVCCGTVLFSKSYVDVETDFRQKYMDITELSK